MFIGPTTAANDETEEIEATQVEVSLKVATDCVNAAGERAAVSGVITESNISSYVGKRMLVVVEDSNERMLQSFTWRVYDASPRNWTPSDAELPFDNGASFSWYATDAERADDVAVRTKGVNVGDCRAVSLSSYELEPVRRGAGSLRIER